VVRGGFLLDTEPQKGFLCSQFIHTGNKKHRLCLYNKSLAVAALLEEFFGDTQDVILDIVVLPDCGDCLSYVGITRESCAIFGGSANDRAKFIVECTAKIAS